MTITSRISTAPMTPYQWVVVALCVLVNCLDGYDVQAIAFANVALVDTFSLTGNQMGLLTSAGLVGMAIGAMFISPYADRIGRRPLILISLVLATIGMFASGFAPNAFSLGGARVVTGLGIGGILASTNVIASEFSNDRRRGLSIGIYTAGYGLGSTFGGMVAREMLSSGVDWRWIFHLGGFLTLAVLIVLALLLPESPTFLAKSQPDNALARINRIFARMGVPAATDADLAAAAASRSETVSVGKAWGQVSRRPLLAASVLAWAVFFLVMFGFYFVNSSTPALLVASGLAPEDAVTAGTAIAFGGALGSVVFGLFAAKVRARVVLLAFIPLGAAAMILFVLSTGALALAYVIGVFVGLLLNGCVAGVYTITPELYPTRIRTSGMGIALGMGRIGAVLAPWISLSLTDVGWSTTQIYVGAAIVVAVCVLPLVLLRRHDDIAVELERAEVDGTEVRV